VVGSNSLFQNCVKEGCGVKKNYLPLFLLRSAGVLNSWQTRVNLLLGFAALRRGNSLPVSPQSLLQAGHWLDSNSLCVCLCACAYRVNGD